MGQRETQKTVFIQNWEESERGWGTRPDGFTVHTSFQQLTDYVSWYNKTFNNLSEAPDEYTRTSGKPIEVEVSKELFEKIEQHAARKHEGRTVNCVHGIDSYWSTSPMRVLKEKDVELGR